MNTSKMSLKTIEKKLYMPKYQQNSFTLFTPGPTKIHKHILELGLRQLPYNRTEKFSAITYEIIKGLQYVFQTKGDIAILTASGTAAMEASVINFVSKEDRVLIINGGTFGQRWVDLCQRNDINYEEIPLKPGEELSLEILKEKIKNTHFTTLLINAHETTTGVLYDIEKIGKITHKENIFLIVDGISTICADPFFMDDWHVDVTLLSSQKALALPPGLSFIALNEKAKEKMAKCKIKSLYFDLKDYLKNQERGQMPYTPAIGLFMMLQQRLADIQEIGLQTVINNHKELADYFRTKIEALPLSIFTKTPSNGITAVQCENGLSAYDVVQKMDQSFNTYLTSNGGELKDKVFRISHMGDQTKEEIDTLINNLSTILIQK